jgi:hypothetical protein
LVAAAHSKFNVAGQVITGFVQSLTMTWKLQLAVWPLAAVIVYVIVLVPNSKLVPNGILPVPLPVVAPLIVYATLELGQFSIPIGLIAAVLDHMHALSAQTSTALLGQAMLGMALSTTVMVKLQALILPQLSVAVNTIVVVPKGKVCPLAMPLVKATVAGRLQSVATGVL